MDLRGDFVKKSEVFPIAGTKTAQREEIPETASAKKHQQRRPQRPAGNRVTEKYDKAAEKIEARTVSNRLEYTQRDAHQITQEKIPSNPGKLKWETGT